MSKAAVLVLVTLLCVFTVVQSFLGPGAQRWRARKHSSAAIGDDAGLTAWKRLARGFPSGLVAKRRVHHPLADPEDVSPLKRKQVLYWNLLLCIPNVSFR